MAEIVAGWSGWVFTCNHDGESGGVQIELHIAGRHTHTKAAVSPHYT